MSAPAERWSDASAPIWELTSGYASLVRAEKQLVALQAYVDDSASETGDRRLFLAGYINTADKWIRFSDAWQEQLQASPSITYLKMKEANSLRGQFRGWTEPDRDEKLKGLARVIRHFRPASIHASVSRSEVEAIIKPVAPYGFSSPYFHCFQAIMISLAYSQLERTGLRVPIDFIFDDQEGLGEEARLLYQLIREAQPRSVRRLLSKSPIFVDDKRMLPLQAADMLAWHVRRSHERDPDKFWVPEFISADGLHMATDYNAEQLRGIADGLSKIPGTASLKSKAAWKKTRREIVRQVDAGGVPSFALARWKNWFVSMRRRIRRLLHLGPW